MPNKKLGKAQYRAFRSGLMLRLVATGETPHFNDKTDFEMLPFKIYPPMYAFYFIEAEILMPAVRPFVYEETISFPQDRPSIRIQDADGFHDVEIVDLAVAADGLPEPGPQDTGFCVFSHTAGDELLLVASCDAPLPAIYLRVFGPESYSKCQDYLKSHKGGGI